MFFWNLYYYLILRVSFLNIDKLISGLPWWLSGKKIHLPMQEMQVQSVGQEDPLEKEMATHSSVLAWEIPWIEKLGRLQSTGVTKESNTT